MLNLRDKLLQAGVVSQDDVKKAEAEAAKRRSAPPPRTASRPNHARSKPKPQPKRELTPEEKVKLEEEKAHREHQAFLNKERDENRKRALQDRQRQEKLRELAEKNELTERGTEPFHFVSRKNKLLRLYLTPSQREQLEQGQLAVIEKPLPAEIAFSLVPRATVEEVIALDPKGVRFYNRGDGQTFGFKGDVATAGNAPDAKEATDLDASGSMVKSAQEAAAPEGEPSAS